MEQQIKWLKRFLGIETDELPAQPSELYLRTVEIQTRIAAIRSSLGWTEQSDKHTPPSSELAVATEQPATIKAGPGDLKAKLLAMKK